MQQRQVPSHCLSRPTGLRCCTGAVGLGSPSSKVFINTSIIEEYTVIPIDLHRANCHHCLFRVTAIDLSPTLPSLQDSESLQRCHVPVVTTARVLLADQLESNQVKNSPFPFFNTAEDPNHTPVQSTSLPVCQVFTTVNGQSRNSDSLGHTTTPKEARLRDKQRNLHLPISNENR
jgi:hypothetical protein